ncbi:MAG TPA: hypothetical protein VF838_17755 [Trebonia sp.]
MHAIGVRDPEKLPARDGRPRRWPWLAGAVLACTAVLFFCYLRIAGTVRVNSDAAGLVLQASDMLHGNLLLHGWWDTDVSYITTELPEYMGVTAAAGVRPDVVHICSALTYTLLVLLAAFVARGRARGAEGIVRALLAATVMLAPQPNGPTQVLLGSPDHVGTAVPLLLLLLLLDRAPDPRARARWYFPVAGAVCIATAALLAWVIIGDPLAEVVGIVPLVIACLLRAFKMSVIRSVRAWREVVYLVLLAGAAALAYPLAQLGNSLIRSHYGYQLGPNRYGLLPWHAMAKDVPMLWQSFLVLFGADYSGVHGAGNVAFALAHLAGVAVVIAGIGFGLWRLVVPSRAARAGDLVADFLVLAVLVNIAAYFAFVQPANIYDAHEIGPVLAFGAALAGRMLGGPLLRAWRAAREKREKQPDKQAQEPGSQPRPRLSAPRRPAARVLVSVLAAGLACYVALLGVAAASPQSAPQNDTLTTWLSEHRLTSGIASYWEASSVTVNSGGKITMLAVGIHGSNHLLGPDKWETDVRLDNPKAYSMNFVVAGPDRIVPVKLAVRMFGKPARTYRYGPYTIMVWDKNLLGPLNPA